MRRQCLRRRHRQDTGAPARWCGKKTHTPHKGRKAPADWTHRVIDGLMASPVVKQILIYMSRLLSSNPSRAARQHDGHNSDLRCGDTGHVCWCRSASLEDNRAITHPSKQGFQQGGGGQKGRPIPRYAPLAKAWVSTWGKGDYATQQAFQVSQEKG